MRIRNDLIPGIPKYDADFDGDTAPYMWGGSASINGSAVPWRDAPLGSLYFDINRRVWYTKRATASTTADWETVKRIAQNVITVGSGGDYARLSEAMSAITDASVSKQYTLVIADRISETATITWKNHVHAFWLPGASVTVTTTTTGHAISLTSLTNVILAAADPTQPHVIRSGAVSGVSYGISLSGCSSGVKIVNLYVSNQTTGAANCHGIVTQSSSAPTMTNCTGIGGGGANSYGIVIQLSSAPTMTNCTGIGGGGTGCHGIVTLSSSAPTMTNCTGIGGGVLPTTYSGTITATARQDDAIAPSATKPYRLIGIQINVTAAAAAGVTLTFRTASGGGGNAITGAVAVDSTGTKNFPVTGYYVLAAGASFYGRLSASDSTLAYTITCVYTTEYTTCYGLYHDSDARSVFLDCDFLSNGSSSAVYVTATGTTRALFAGGTVSSGENSSSRPAAFAAASAWSNAPVYNMVFNGGSINVTAAAGTANGSNVEV